MQGNCLCGAVSINIADNYAVGACHCGTCRQWNSGAPLFTINCGSDIKVTGLDHIVNYRSSSMAERGFCKQCGTHLYYHFLSPSFYSIAAGLFPHNEKLALSMQVFIDKKPDYYTLADQTPTLTEQQVIERFSKA